MSYQLEKAKADAINVDTMVKWNKALRARQLALREEKRKEATKREAEREVQGRADGAAGTGPRSTTCSLQILDVDPAAVKSGGAKTPISASAIREIPFEWDSEAITFASTR